MFKIWRKKSEKHGLALNLFGRKMQHIIFYAHVHACSPSSELY